MTYLNLEQLGEVHEGLDLVLEDAHLAVVHEVHEIGELCEPYPGRHDEYRVLARIALEQGPFEEEICQVRSVQGGPSGCGLHSAS